LAVGGVAGGVVRRLVSARAQFVLPRGTLVPTDGRRSGHQEKSMDAIVSPTPGRRVDVTGDDRVRYLADVTSQQLLDVPVTHVRSALYLDVHGAPLAMFDVAVLGDRLALIVPDDDVLTTVVETLGGRTFLLDARFTAHDHVAIAVRGDDAAAAISAAGLTSVEGRCRLAGDLLILSRPGGIDVLGPQAAITEAVEALAEAGARRAEDGELETWRIRHGIPAWGREVVAPHLPEEVGLLPSHVHLAKGCYPGQEAVARMWMLGRPRRRLAVVEPHGGGVEPGWEAGTGKRAVHVTSVAPTGEVALAFVPSDAQAGDAFSDDAGSGVEVVELIGVDPAPPGHDPGMKQRRDRPRS
jgi:tRNA-modifying protein YgfZ